MIPETENVPFFAKVTFLIEGFSSLIAWNSILTAFDFIALSYPEYNVSFTLTVPVFIGQTLLALFIYQISNYFSLNARIVSALSIMALILLILPITTTFVVNLNGFLLCAFLLFFLGAFNSLMQSSSIALASLFPSQCMSLLFTGTGFAGVLICLLRIIVLLIFGEDEKGIVFGTIVYFSISGFFLIITIALHFAFRKTWFCKYFIRKAKTKSLLGQEELVEDLVLNPIDLYDEVKKFTKDEAINELSMPQIKHYLEVDHNKCNKELKLSRFDEMSRNGSFVHSEKVSWTFVWNVLIKIMPFPLLCWFIFVQTFLMFPGITLKKQLTGFSVSMSCTLLILAFNVFDTLGKYLTSRFQTSSVVVLTGLIFIRFLHFPFFILMTGEEKIPIVHEDWFAFANISIFALIHGYVVSNLMIFAPTKAKNMEKETAGFLMGLPLTVGIVTGSLLALSYANAF